MLLTFLSGTGVGVGSRLTCLQAFVRLSLEQPLDRKLFAVPFRKRACGSSVPTLRRLEHTYVHVQQM